MSLKYLVLCFRSALLCNAVSPIAQIGNCGCFKVTPAGLCWLHILMSRHSPGEGCSACTPQPPYRLSGHPVLPKGRVGGCVGFVWGVRWESTGPAGTVLLVEDAEGPATLLYEEHVVVQRGWGGCCHLCHCQALKLFPGAGRTSKERITSFSLVCSGGARAAAALPCHVCESLTRFERRLPFAVRCRHSSAGRMRTRCVVRPHSWATWPPRQLLT